MLQAFVITLREGLEAFLIVAISLAYLKKTGRQALVPAVHWGIAAAVAASIALGVLLQRAMNQALWEAVLALVAAVLVATLIVHMWRIGRRMKAQIEGRLESSAVKAGAAAFFGVFGFTVLMIAREGMETALLMNALLFQVKSPQIIAGAIGGTALAAFVATVPGALAVSILVAVTARLCWIPLAVIIVVIVVVSQRYAAHGERQCKRAGCHG